MNYEPPAPIAATETGTVATAEIPQHANISTLHLEMRVRALYRNSEIELVSPMATCGSGCRRMILSDRADEVEILRFAKDGVAPPPQRFAGTAFGMVRRAWPARAHVVGARWLVTMEDGVGLRGTISGESSIEEPNGSGGTLRLGGRMVITIQVGGWGRPVRLLSRDEPILEGAVPAWPPRGGSIELVNGPIHYYDEREVDSPGREPVLSVTANSVEFGLDEVALLARPPQIRSAHVVRDGTPERGARTSGVELQWDDTRGHVIDEPPVRWYHVYRQFEGDALNGWVRVRSLPANVTKWVDRGFDGTQAALYLVLHAGEYPFGYRYESLLPTPVRVAASLEASPA